MPRHKERTSVHDEGERRETFFDEAQLGTFTSLTASSSGSGLDVGANLILTQPCRAILRPIRPLSGIAQPTDRSLSFCISHASVR